MVRLVGAHRSLLTVVCVATSGNDSGKTDMTRKQEQLRLALEWNRIDIAKNCIMRNERDWEVRRSHCSSVFLEALVRYAARKST